MQTTVSLTRMLPAPNPQTPFWMLLHRRIRMNLERGMLLHRRIRMNLERVRCLCKRCVVVILLCLGTNKLCVLEMRSGNAKLSVPIRTVCSTWCSASAGYAQCLCRVCVVEDACIAWGRDRWCLCRSCVW